MKVNGFGLVEVLISAALIASTIGALFAVTSMTIRMTTLGQDRFIASEYAREGIEGAKQIRDGNFVTSETICQNRCDTWWAGLGEPGSKKLMKLEKDVTTGFHLAPVAGSERSESGCQGEVLRRSLAQNKQQVYCRRVFLEPVRNAEETVVNESERSIRIRSQVAWLGYGRNHFRSFAGTVQDENSCQNPRDATEWCSEQVIVLTDWRPSL